MGLTNLLNLRDIDISGLKIVNTGNYPLFIIIFCYFNCPSLTEGIGGGGVHLRGYSGHYRAPWHSRVSCVGSPQVNAKGCVLCLVTNGTKFASPKVEQ